MPFPTIDSPRRRLFLSRAIAASSAHMAALACLGPAPIAASAQSGARAAGGRPLRVVQLLDTSAGQQELARDYSTGVRLAFTELSKAGVRVPQLVSAQTDGTADSTRQALRGVQADPGQVLLLGAVGERLALDSIDAAKQIGLDIAHVAPWMADTRFDTDRQVFPIFASRDAQIRHALQSLATVGFKDIGLVYASDELARSMHPGILQTTHSLQLGTQQFTAGRRQDMERFGAGLPPTMPAILLFLGGTLELAQFTKGLSRRNFQRYVVCLSDVDTTTLQQVGTGAGVPLIFTQVVPNPDTSSAPVVRAYRAGLKQYYDEAPSSVSLAGYVAGLYAARTLARLESGATRAAALAEFQRKSAVDLGGVRIDYSNEGRGSRFVSQAMLSPKGKLIG